MISRAVAVLAMSAGALLITADPAGAEATGGCEARINGLEISSRSATDPADAIEVSKNESITVEAESPDAITGYEVYLELFGLEWKIGDGPASGNAWTRDVNVADYAKYGVGLYRVRAVSKAASGGCTGAALVRVAGSPMGSMAGMAAVGLVGVGAFGLAAAVSRAWAAGGRAS